jgi:hypothetical protein
MRHIRAFRFAQARVRLFMLFFARLGFPASMALFSVNLFAVFLVEFFFFLFAMFFVERFFLGFRFFLVKVRATRQRIRIRARLRLFVLRFHQPRRQRR